MKALESKDLFDDSESMMVNIPTIFKGTLHKHQVVALNWMYLLHQHKVNGILADEMGLGKTISLISFLALLSEEQISQGPHLIIVPSSIVSNWENEFEKFCPELSVFVYYGTLDERLYYQSRIKKMRKSNRLPNVMISTYNLVCQKTEKKFFKKLKFDYLILDEAQGIKNASSLRHQRITSFDCNHRLLLTGTPIQNNLKELWSLLSFLMPTVFKGFSVDSLPLDEMDALSLQDEEEDQELVVEVEQETEEEKVQKKKEKRRAQLRRILGPFILRRLKKTVAPHLPKKTEHVIPCSMTAEQTDVYKGIIAKELQTEGSSGLLSFLSEISKKNLQNIVMQLRKAANHPQFFRIHYTGPRFEQLVKTLHSLSFTELKKISKTMFAGPGVKEKPSLDDVRFNMTFLCDIDIDDLCYLHQKTQRFCLSDDQLLWSSGKFLQLKTLVPELVLKNHRILIFSQFTTILNVLERFCNSLGLEFCRLDGQTPTLDRQDIINTFNDEQDIKVFLLSTKAGGVGINLTSADTVIFFDSDYNPQNDSQAEDRCHRIGQTKDVTVYRLVAQSTIDEAILETAKKKAELNSQLLDGAFTTRKVSNTSDDFAQILEKTFYSS
ncbi:hypothetical protein GEMRC1_003964 [Eukaryota sp. GEM-RC1]